MCGRYWIDWIMLKEIETLVGELDASMKGERQIWPGERAAVITMEEKVLRVSGKVWGFPGFDRQKLIFNARSETAVDKKMFGESVLSRRCVIPAAGFYEWSKKKERFSFCKEEGALYMAGFYKKYGDEERFVILTTQANESVGMIHDRMPLLLAPGELGSWLGDKEKLREFLVKTPELLNKFTDYEQQSFLKQLK